MDPTLRNQDVFSPNMNYFVVLPVCLLVMLLCQVGRHHPPSSLTCSDGSFNDKCVWKVKAGGGSLVSGSLAAEL